MTARRKLRLEYMALGALRGMDRNAKGHDLEDLERSFQRFGYVQPVMLDERSRRIVAGHGRIEWLGTKKARGDRPPPGIKRQGDEWLVPVIRGVRFKNAGEAEAYALADNQLTIAGGWDGALLAELLEEVDLDGTGFDQGYVDEVLAEFGQEEGSEERQEDEAEPETVQLMVGWRIEVKRDRYVRWKEAIRKRFGPDERPIRREIVKRLKL